MKIGKRATLEEMDAKAWASFSTDAALGLPLIRRRVVEISRSLKDVALDVTRALARPGLDGDALTRFAELVSDRAERCALTV